jgi:O-antigen/teichoic acid export membrane protein
MMILFNTYFPAFTVIVAGTMLSNADIAVYNIGFRIALLVAFGLMAIDSYAAPDIMRLHSKGETAELKKLIDRITRMRFLVALGSIVIFVLLGRWILGFFGDEFTDGYWVLIILGLTQLVQAAVGPVARLLSMTGHQDQGFYISTVSLVIAGVLIVLLTPPFGVVGTAVAALLAITVWSIWMSYIVATRLGLRPALISFG